MPGRWKSVRAQIACLRPGRQFSAAPGNARHETERETETALRYARPSVRHLKCAVRQINTRLLRARRTRTVRNDVIQDGAGTVVKRARVWLLGIDVGAFDCPNPRLVRASPRADLGAVSVSCALLLSLACLPATTNLLCLRSRFTQHRLLLLLHMRVFCLRVVYTIILFSITFLFSRLFLLLFDLHFLQNSRQNYLSDCPTLLTRHALCLIQ